MVADDAGNNEPSASSADDAGDDEPTASLSSDGYVAEAPGALPDDGNPVIDGVQLPTGHRVAPDPVYASDPAAGVEAVLWVTDEPVPDIGQLWSDLQARFPRSGLWPLVLEPIPGAPERPWDVGEFDPSESSNPDDHDVELILSNRWAELLPGEEDDELTGELAPFDTAFPGLAAPTTGPVDESAPQLAAGQMAGRLGLVSVRRPADAVAVIGWDGSAGNYFSDMGELAAVFRSWEDRFGTVVVGLSFDTVTVAIRRPAAMDAEAVAIAAELYALCPDVVWQGAGSIELLATELQDEAGWVLWWD